MSEAYPVDAEGFGVVSRDVCGDMERYNVVVVSVLDEAECKIAQNGLWYAAGPRIDRYDVSTWENANWPNPRHPFLLTDYAEELEAYHTRAHPRLIEAFEALYGTDRLWSTIDHWGIKRPTIGHAEWRLKPLELHWDVDVPSYVKDMAVRRRRYQALCALNDHDRSVGCFSYVPGSANQLPSWWKAYGASMTHPKYVPKPNPWHQLVTALPLRAGHVVIWDMGTAHANTSNFSVLPRLTQFCRMLPTWALDREDQALPHWWKQHPEKRLALRAAFPWSQRQLQVLALETY